MQELSLNVLDIAQNSVRANAHLISITVELKPAEDWMSIIIADDGCGMTAEQTRNVSDPFFTTRTTRKVGLGIPFLKMAAEMTGGSFLIESTLGQGTTVRAVFGYSHIDRMPLGDIAATVCSLVQCNPTIDFVYTYRLNGREFCADTRAFRVILEDVPLSEPEVLTFIGSFIRENTAELEVAETE